MTVYGQANYGRQVLLNPSMQFTGGLATPDINTRGGVFGPQGYGGGIFDGMSGLGQTSTDIRAWQGMLNVELRNRGMEVIPVSGVVDPATCGATLYLVNAYNAGETVYAQLADAFEAGTGEAVAEQCMAVPQPWPPPKKRFGTMQMLTFGAIGVVAFFIAAKVVKKR